MFLWWGDSVIKLDLTKELLICFVKFNNTYPKCAPISKSINQTVSRFERIGSIKHEPKSEWWRTVSNYNKALEILQSAIEYICTELSKMTLQTNISKSTANKIIKKHKMY